MTPPHPDILTVRDAAILKLLHRLVDIGIYRKQWTAADVAHVVNRWLIPREAVVLQLVEPDVEAKPDAPTYELPRGQYAVISQLCRGKTNAGIAEALNVTDETVKSHLRRVYAVIGVNTRAAAIEAILSGHVRVVQKPNGNRKKAS